VFIAGERGRLMPGNSIVIITQVYVPDPAAVGQQIADVAEELVRHGRRVVVYTSSRGYDDPTVRFPLSETRAGVIVRRCPLSSFGKGSIAVRLLAQALFVVQATFRALLTGGVGGVIVSTSPPFAGFAGAVVARLRHAPLLWWVMDLNPDQMVLAGKLRATSLAARVFDWMNRVTLDAATLVVALDRFIAARVLAKRDVQSKLEVLPPWAHTHGSDIVPHDDNPFRHEHGLDGRFVVMYSGNAGFSTPLDTLLAAARQFEADDRLRFMFIGGGVVKREIDALVAATGPPNMATLPYQPLDRIRFSLSAADVHVVSIANEGVGVVHPCKVYGAMALGKPVLAFAPRESYVADILAKHRCGWLVEHGDVAGAVQAIRAAADMPPEELEAIGARAARAAETEFSPPALRAAFCDLVEEMARR
jgi:colanic acid biosynthesis glycosyl transferase WcaI